MLVACGGKTVKSEEKTHRMAQAQHTHTCLRISLISALLNPGQASRRPAVLTVLDRYLVAIALPQELPGMKVSS